MSDDFLQRVYSDLLSNFQQHEGDFVATTGHILKQHLDDEIDFIMQNMD